MGEIIEFKARAKKLKAKSSTSSKRFKISIDVVVSLISIILAGAFIFLSYINAELALDLMLIFMLVCTIVLFVVWVVLDF
ncbi:MAG: hypothetical protein IKP66_04605 [Lachnospiraceae bacterium]|nr:hypothetical protein [Lachnospiraceae bacterium]